MIQSKTLLVDGMNILWRAYYMGTPVDAFFNIILRRLYAEHYDRFIVCWDRENSSSFRKKVFPGYKSHRMSKDDPRYIEVVSLKRRIMKILYRLGSFQSGVAGPFEADDLIGSITMSLTNITMSLTNEVHILSSDSDMEQLVQDSGNRVVLFSPTNGGGEKRVDKDVLDHIYGGVSIAEVKALSGDKSDGYPGCPGIGKKTAIKLLLKVQSLSSLIDRARFNTLEKPVCSLIVNNEKSINDSLECATIRDSIDFQVSKGKLNRDAAHALMVKYGSRSVLSHMDKLIECSCDWIEASFRSGAYEHFMICLNNVITNSSFTDPTGLGFYSTNGPMLDIAWK